MENAVSLDPGNVEFLKGLEETKKLLWSLHTFSFGPHFSLVYFPAWNQLAAYCNVATNPTLRDYKKQIYT